MSVLLPVLLVLLVAGVKSQGLSCARTSCLSDETCGLVQTCDASGGCDAAAPQCLKLSQVPTPVGTCNYEAPLLHKVGDTITELQCSANGICPDGSLCDVVDNVCCTGAPKTIGTCPAQRSLSYLLLGPCGTFCRHDQECQGHQLCCQTSVRCKTCVDPMPTTSCQGYPCPAGLHCVMAESPCDSFPCMAEPTCVEDKQGICPTLDPVSACADECSGDSHCPGDAKCCSAGGCSVCRPPAASATPSTTADSTGTTTEPPGTTTPDTTGTTPGATGTTPVSGAGGVDNLLGVSWTDLLKELTGGMGLDTPAPTPPPPSDPAVPSTPSGGSPSLADRIAQNAQHLLTHLHVHPSTMNQPPRPNRRPRCDWACMMMLSMVSF